MNLILSAFHWSSWTPAPNQLHCSLLDSSRKCIPNMSCRSLSSIKLSFYWNKYKTFTTALEISNGLGSCFIVQSHCWDGWYSQFTHCHSCRDSIICLKQEQAMILMTAFNLWDCLGHTSSWNHNWGFQKSLENLSGQINSVNVVRNLALKSPGSSG